MKKIVYMLAVGGVVLTILGADTFVLSKKESTKKKPRITPEHIIAGDGDLLQDITTHLKELAALQDTTLNNIRVTLNQEKPNLVKDASQQQRHQYDECTRKMQHALKECSQCIIEQQAIRNRCFKK
jgi:hypothetical protein